MKKRLIKPVYLFALLGINIFCINALVGQITAEEFQEEHDSIQLFRAKHFDDMRRLNDGSMPDIWQAFQRIKQQQADNRNLLPAANWTCLGPNTMDSLGGRMTCHAFNPLNSQTLLSGAAGGGLWKSTNGGDFWFPLTDDLPSLRISAIAFHPQDTNHLLMGTGFYHGNSFTIVPGIGLLESFDGGETWLPNSLQFPFANGISISRIVWDRSDPMRVYVGASNGVWRSTDAGLSWENTLPGRISDLEVVAATPERLYAAIHSVGIYRSDNNGQDWVLLSNGLPSTDIHRINIAVCDAAPNFALASIVRPGSFGLKGLYKTSDGGDTWQLVANPPSYLCDSNCLGWLFNVVEVSPVDSNTIVLGGPRLYRSIDGGQSWLWRDYYSSPLGSNKEGLVYVDQWDAGFDPMNPEVIYVFNDGGIFKSTDTGSFWEKKNEGLVTGQFYRIASFPKDSNLIIGGIQDHGLHYLDNSNGNTNWSIWWIGDGCSVSFDPNDPKKVYGDNIFTFHYRSNDVTGGLFSTSNFNGGLSGTNSIPFHFVTTHHPTESNSLYTANDTRIFKTTNGLNWTAVANVPNVRAMAISPAKPSTAYAATYNNSQWAFYASLDDGETWSQTTNAPGWRVTDLEGDPNHHGTVYATRNSAFAGNPHVYKSTNHGENWVPISAGLPDIPTWTITINPFNSDVLYIGTDLGVFISEDAGQSWNEYNDHLPPYYVMDMHYHPLDSTLRIATLGRGVWKTKSIPNIKTATTNIELASTILKAFPNPFAQTLNIKITLEESKSIRLSILNMLGQEVKLITNGSKRPGDYSYNWNGKNQVGKKLPSGIYFVQLRMGDYKMNRQVVLE